MEEKRCTSCGVNVAFMKDATSFKCPECGAMLNRCAKCRKGSVKFKCRCGFEGP